MLDAESNLLEKRMPYVLLTALTGYKHHHAVCAKLTAAVLRCSEWLKISYWLYPSMVIDF